MSAFELEGQILRLADEFPLQGEIQISILGDLSVATLLDGSQAVARVIGTGSRA